MLRSVMLASTCFAFAILLLSAAAWASASSPFTTHRPPPDSVRASAALDHSKAHIAHPLHGHGKRRHGHKPPHPPGDTPPPSDGGDDPIPPLPDPGAAGPTSPPAAPEPNTLPLFCLALGAWALYSAFKK